MFRAGELLLARITAPLSFRILTTSASLGHVSSASDVNPALLGRPLTWIPSPMQRGSPSSILRDFDPSSSLDAFSKATLKFSNDVKLRPLPISKQLAA
jgi:hypothetical protein